MTNVGELYVCKICGNAVEVVVAGAGRLVCCGQPMELRGRLVNSAFATGISCRNEFRFLYIQGVS